MCNNEEREREKREREREGGREGEGRRERERERGMREGERGRGREKIEEREREGERERAVIYVFSSFFSVHYFLHVLVPTWAPKGGTGNASCPPVEKLAGQVSPKNDISETFFLTSFKMLYFPTFAK